MNSGVCVSSTLGFIQRENGRFIRECGRMRTSRSDERQKNYGLDTGVLLPFSFFGALGLALAPWSGAPTQGERHEDPSALPRAQHCGLEEFHAQCPQNWSFSRIRLVM